MKAQKEETRCESDEKEESTHKRVKKRRCGGVCQGTARTWF
uniref:Uncharacterized protein n=1 Tax=Coprothermobacter proteolyticus (strain ATCC 35245 / DSM 5265 / OCM 4 / BT) TaxID=309798 RepID=B5Y721_COPPD